MLHFKNKNLVLLHGSRSHWRFYEIIDFLDLDSHNFLYLRNEKVKDGRFTHFFESIDEIESIIDENKFRVTHLIIEWKNFSNGAYVVDDLFKQMYSRFKLPIIFLMPHIGSTILDNDNFDQVFVIRDDHHFDWQVEDIKNKWNSSLENLKTTWIREEKINQLFRGFKSE